MATLVLSLGLTSTAGALTPGSGGSRDCSDFSSQREAQAVYNQQNGDPDNLDADQDGFACEEFFSSGSRSSQYDDDNAVLVRGIASGGGGTAPTGPDLLPLLLGGTGIALLATAGGLVAARRRP